MKIQNNYFNYNLYNTDPSVTRQGFGAAKDINLKYIYQVHFDILPKRIQEEVEKLVKAGKQDSITLYDLHKDKYAPLLDCKTLDEARNTFLEFREVLDADAVIVHKSPNIKKIMEKVSLEDLSLHLLKERWANLKTLDEIAKDLGLKNRVGITWLKDKIRVPDFAKNYTTLLRSSDETYNAIIASKTQAYNALHYNDVLEKNRRLSQENIELNRYIFQEAWDRLPHIRQTLSEISRTVPPDQRFEALWGTFPEYAKELAEMKREIAAEIRGLNKKR